MNDRLPESRSKKSRRGGRRSRRSRAHAEAEAAALENAPAPRVIDHPLVPQDRASIIKTSAELSAFIEHVRDRGEFAYDTEFIGEETYHPLICLIQIATTERIAVVDPLSDLDVTGVWELIADPGIETIVHAGAIDLEPAPRLIERPPANVFDTQIAAAFTGCPYPLGLRQLVEEMLGVRMGKGLTFTDWSRRPLSKAHVRYAADDVRYLPALRQALRERLDEAGHTQMALEECAALSDPARYGFDADSAYGRVIGNRNLESKNRSILRELVILRDQLSREENLPPRTLMRDDVLISLAREPARDVERLARVSGFPKPIARKHGERFIAAIEQALAMPASKRPERRSPEESFDERIRIDGLWAAISAYCIGRRVDPSMVTNRRELARLYLDAKRSGDFDRPWFEGWREAFVGGPIRELLTGQGRITLSWPEDRLDADCASSSPDA